MAEIENNRPTPRTDKAEAMWGTSNVFMGFVRGLERENAELMANLKLCIIGFDMICFRLSVQHVEGQR